MKHDRHTYRGKALSDQHVKIGEWVYGGLFKTEDGCWIVRLSPGEFEAGIIQHIRVDPDTVGQCTGLTDKNGTAIFEGDVLEYVGRYRYVVRFGSANFNPPCCADDYRIGWYLEGVDRSTNDRAEPIHDNSRFAARFPEHCADYPENANMFIFEIIGNIHDNPEMVGVGK